MNKIIKLVLIFAAILGVVVGAFFLSKKNEEVTPIGPNNMLEIYRKQIENAWEQKADWDLELYKSHVNLLKQLSTRGNVESLKDLNRTLAAEIIHGKIFSEWALPKCNNQTIRKYAKAVSDLVKCDTDASANPLVVQINDVNRVYKNARSLALRELQLAPGYDGKDWTLFEEYSKKDWTSFEEYSKRIEQEKSDILTELNKPAYSPYLSNILEIKNGLNNVPNRLKKAKEIFYEKLAKEIIEYYEKIPRSERTEEQLNALRQSRNTYAKEYKENDQINECARQFNDDVRRNSSNEEM